MVKGKKKISQKWKFYEVKGGKVVRKNKFCLCCGLGVFMVNYKDCWFCGRCGYIEWKK